MKQFSFFFFLCSTLFLHAQPADSTAKARQVDSLVQIAAPLIGQRKFEEASAILVTAKKLALDGFGQKHPLYAACLYQEGRIFHNTNKVADAERAYLEVKSIREKALGTDHLDYAAVLLNMGMLYVGAGRYAEAEPLYEEVKTIRKNKLGADHPDYAGVLASMGVLYVRINRFDEAEQCHKEAMTIREKHFGKGHPDYIGSVNNLGTVYYRSGRFEEAEQAYLEVKNFREKKLGKGHIEYARIVSNLANVYSDMGRYEEAERYYTEIKALQEKSPGKESADYGLTLSYLGVMCKDLGRYEEAAQHLEEAVSTLETVFGKDHIEYAGAVERLANLYYTLGRYEAAKPLYNETATIREKLLSREHPDFGAALNNQAVLAMAKKDYREAEQYYLTAKSIQENQKEIDSLQLAWLQNNLAILYTKTGRYAQADSLLVCAKTIREKSLGKEHPVFANTLEDLALVYQKTGKTKEAIDLLTAAKVVFEKNFGQEHQEVALCLNRLADLHFSIKNMESAEACYLQANAIQRNLLARNTRFASEREIAAFAQVFSEDLDVFFAFARHRTGKSPVVASVVFDNAIYHKGFLLTATSQVRNLIHADTVLTRQFESLAAYHRRLSVEYTKPVGERKDVASLEKKANELERALTQATASLGQAYRQVGWKGVQSNMKQGEAAIEFIRFRQRGQTDSLFYAALVLTPTDAAPKFVELFEEKSLDSLFRLHGERRSDYVADLYAYTERGARVLGKPSKTLYDLIWQPLEQHLKDVQTVYFSPAGFLHRINIGAIPLGLEETVADRHRLVQMGSTRQLAVGETFADGSNRQTALLLGAVQYEMDSIAIAQANLELTDDLLATRNVAGATRNIPINLTDTRGRGIKWNNLVWTEKEVGNVENILTASGFRIVSRKGYAATEELFKSVGKTSLLGLKPSPRIIHLATHGYFFPDPIVSDSVGRSMDGEPVFKIAEHPMIRSGLVLAGGNHAWLTGKPLVPGSEDGILTAYEISQMNLAGTELVVLSACETGLGDIQGNEGVFGLQRALKIAGAKYVIMSLWQVPDKKTSNLMISFYKNWMEEKMSIPDAFGAAQKAMRDAGDDPYNWAGFVLLE